MLAVTNTVRPCTVNGSPSTSATRPAMRLGLRRGLQVGADDHELVAAGASRHVAVAEHAVEPAGEVHEELVAGGVAHRVVHELEAVEVQEQHRGVRAGPLGAGEGRLEVVDEQGAVRQARERVVGRVVGELLLERLAHGEVHHHAVEPPRLPVVVADRLTTFLDPAPTAVAVQDLVLDEVGLAERDVVRDLDVDAVAMFGGDEVVQLHRGSERLRRVAGQVLDRVADEHVAVRRIDLAAEDRARARCR